MLDIPPAGLSPPVLVSAAAEVGRGMDEVRDPKAAYVRDQYAAVLNHLDQSETDVRTTPPEPEITQRASVTRDRPEKGRPTSDADRGGRTITVRVEKERIDKMKAVIDHIGPRSASAPGRVRPTAIDKHIEELQTSTIRASPSPNCPRVRTICLMGAVVLAPAPAWAPGRAPYVGNDWEAVPAKGRHPG